jgi:hypothetical protein
MTLLSALTEKTSPVGTDMVYLLSDPSGTPADAKCSLTNVLSLAPTQNTRFAINSGNVTSNVSDLLTYTTGTLKTKTGGSYVNATVTNAQGTVTTISSEKTLDMSGYTNGTYNVFLKTDGTLEAFSNPVTEKDFYCDFSQGATVDNYGLCVPTVGGTPTYTGNKFNSATATYVSVPFKSFGTDAWCVQGKFNTSSLSALQNIVENGYSSNDLQGMILRLQTSGKLLVYINSATGGSWDIASGVEGTKVFSINTDYYIRIRFTGSHYYVDWSANGSSWTNDIDVSSSATLIADTNNLIFGYCAIYDNTNVFNGTMDELQITIGNSTCVTKNQMNIQQGTPLYNQTNNIWVKSLEPLSAYIYTSGNYNTSYTGTYLGTATVASGVITSVTTQKYVENSVHSSIGFPGTRYISLSLLASDSTYTAPADGWYLIDKIASATGQYGLVSVGSIWKVINVYSPAADWHYSELIPVKKNDVLTFSYTLAGATQQFRFIYAEGAI